MINDKRDQILEYVKSHITEKGFAPSIREICRKFGFSSPRSGQKYLESLEEQGLIKRAGVSRGIKILSDSRSPISGLQSLTTLPFLGYIAAGMPIEVMEQKEEIEVPRALVSKRPCYVLQVKGNSMIDDHIVNGDFIVVEKADTADNGEVVVALVGGNSATLKRMYREKNRVRLEPANSTMKPIYVKDIAIQGRVKGLFRKF
jgi:repressor LexA